MQLSEVFVVGFLLGAASASRVLSRDGRASDPEVDMETSELISSKGYPSEEYEVVTSDKYILRIQRIPHGKNATQPASARPVVLLWHPLLSCSACWVENLANESLGFLMADAGFDVWLGNSRGNTYARRHVTLTPDDDDFWDFSYDEMALYDLPATVDKILSITGASDLFYVGHSQGGAIGYAGLSADPSLASKVKMFAALAPAVYVKDMRSPVRNLAPLAGAYYAIANLFGVKEFLSYGPLYNFMADNFCGVEAGGFLCQNLIFTICGFNEAAMNVSRIPVYVGHHPAGTSVRNMVHFAQMVQNERFQMFDFGSHGNKRKYNQATPPTYDIASMNVPVALFYGTDDWLVDPKEIRRLISETNHLVYSKEIAGWEHLDFMWAMNAPGECYDKVIDLFKGLI